MFTAQQCQMIDAMGLGPVWISRTSVDPLLAPAPTVTTTVQTPTVATPAAAVAPTPAASPEVTQEVRAPRVHRPREEGVDNAKVDAFMRRVKAPDRRFVADVEDENDTVPVTPERYRAAKTRDDLIALVKEEVSQLRPQLSPLVVFDGGDATSDVMIVGIEPGATEMLNAQPFSGTALTLLEGMLREIGLTAETTYQTNWLKFRRHHNEVLEPKREACADALFLAQLNLTQAKAILFMGDDVANRFLGETEKAGVLECNGRRITAIRSHSMTDLLRSPLLKASVWHDLLQVKRALGGAN